MILRPSMLIHELNCIKLRIRTGRIWIVLLYEGKVHDACAELLVVLTGGDVGCAKRVAHS
jgi:hypothetical protein